MNTETLKFHQSLIEARERVFKDAQNIFNEKAIEAHVFGSVGREDSDAYSDLDIWFTFKDMDIKEVLEKRFEYYSSIGKVVHVCEPPQNRPVNGVHSFVLYKTSAGLLQVDYYLCPQSTSFQTNDSKKIFGTTDLPQGELGINSQKITVDQNYRIDFVIFIAFIAIKNLARREEGALDNLINEYGNLSERYRFSTVPLLNKENTFKALGEVIENLKKVSNDRKKEALLEIDTFFRKVEAMETNMKVLS